MKIKHPILRRENINFELNNIFNYPLTIIVAAMGYGKSTAVRYFLDETNTRYIWLSVESDENSVQYIWESFARQLTKTVPELGDRLNTLGFPVDAPHRDRVFKTMEEYIYGMKTVLVIDDYQFALSPELNVFIERMIRLDITGLHTVIITRTKPDINIEDLCLKGYCYLLKSDLFELSREEIIKFFRLFGNNISTDNARQVHFLSEGWITAVYLIMQRYIDTGKIEHGKNIQSLIEKTIMVHYSYEEKRVLTALSILESFSLEQAVYIINNVRTSEVIKKLSESNSLIRYDDRIKKYKIHNIFKNYLNILLTNYFEDTHLDNLYMRAGEWSIKEGNIIKGLKFYLKGKQYELILAEFEKEGITKVTDRFPQTAVELFARIPKEVKFRYPIGYITYVDFYLSCVDPEGGSQLLSEIEYYYQNDNNMSYPLKKRIFGEIQLSRSLLFFNDLQKMHEYQLKAYQLLDGSSSISNRDMNFTFGSPHTLYLYHREKGKLLWITNYVDKVFHYYREMTNGCGTGFEELARAEYCLETCDFANSKIYAYKALYKARNMNQISLIICAKFVLIRLHIAQGRFNETRKLIQELKFEVTSYNNSVYYNTLDLCEGYISGILNEPQNFAVWLKTGDMEQSGILYQGMGFNYIIYGKWLLTEGNNIKSEVLCEEMFQHFTKYNNIFGYLHAHILNTAAKYKLYGIETAKKAVLPALDIGRKDNIILPFAEYGLYIIDVLKTLHKEVQNDEYLNNLIEKVFEYCRNLKSMQKEKEDTNILTKREREVLKLVVDGRTNREISSILYIAEVTVRKNITSIYQKLGVGGRVSAVKKAIDKRII